MLISSYIIAACCLGALAVTEDQDIATFSSLGEPFSSATIVPIKQELSARVASIWVNPPERTICGGCLIDQWNMNTGTSVARHFHVSEIDSAMASMPAVLTQKVKSIVFATNVHFEMFRHTIDAPTLNAQYTQYLGIARRNGTDVEIAVLKGQVIGRLVPKTSEHRGVTCGRILWWQCCCRHWVTHSPRGYHVHEIAMIETGLRSETVKRLKEKISEL